MGEMIRFPDLSGPLRRQKKAPPGGKPTLDAWNHVSVPLGTVADGRRVMPVDVGYDPPAGTGGYRGLVDDIRITR